MTAEELDASASRQTAALTPDPKTVAGAGAGQGLVVAAWLAVWIPLGWGVWVTLQKAVLLFK